MSAESERTPLHQKNGAHLVIDLNTNKMVSCIGCQESFSATGYSQHLVKTRQASCMAVLAASHTANSRPRSLTPRSPSLAPTEDQPMMFEGDFFGTYGEDDIEGSGDDTSDSSNEEEGLYDSGEWEPPIHWQDGNKWEPPVDEGDQTPEEIDNIEARQQIKEHIAGQDNIIIVPYPDACAGKPITGCPTRCANATYGLDAGSTANIYAPFASRIDWDIAKWAKLCGPSSTAFTDLLGIDGVSASN